MDVDAAFARHGKNRLRQQQTIGRNGEHIDPRLGEHRSRCVTGKRCRLRDGNAPVKRQSLDRRRRGGARALAAGRVA
jgi:hypothetical protein